LIYQFLLQEFFRILLPKNNKYDRYIRFPVNVSMQWIQKAKGRRDFPGLLPIYRQTEPN